MDFCPSSLVRILLSLPLTNHGVRLEQAFVSLAGHGPTTHVGAEGQQRRGLSVSDNGFPTFGSLAVGVFATMQPAPRLATQCVLHFLVSCARNSPYVRRCRLPYNKAPLGHSCFSSHAIQRGPFLLIYEPELKDTFRLL